MSFPGGFVPVILCIFFFFNDTATTEIYTLSLHDALPILKNIPWLIYPIMFLIGFYGGFIQVGVGFILLASIHFILKVNLVYANMHKIMVVLIYTIPVILIFLFTDNINWEYGLSLAVGNSFGGWWSAKFAVRKGEKFVKTILIAAIFIIALKLLNIF